MNLREVIYLCRCCNKPNRDFSCECTKLKPEMWDKIKRSEMNKKCRKKK